MTTATEIRVNTLHEPLGDGTARRLTAAELHQRALELRPGWLARELGRRPDEARIAAALDADPDLDAAFEPGALDDERVGIVVDEARLDRLRSAVTPGTDKFAVALVGDLTADGGWLISASGAEEAVSNVQAAVPRVQEVTRDELMVWAADSYRRRYLLGGDFPDTWIVLDA